MELLLGDCLELMPEIKDNSVDLLFCDLPYGQTSCKWDSLIDLEKFWKEVNRVCKIDTPMLFTCSVKFGNTLINSNTKNFRYDLIWVKSSAVGFLNAKKMPMKKHEMIYVFYRKLPKIYTENISLHHTHKFIKETENVIKEGTHGNAYNTENRNKPIIRSKANQYDPPLPNSIITRTDEGCNGLYGKETNKKFIYDEKGKLRNSEPMYDPPLPNSVIKNEVYNQLETGHNPNNLTAEEKKTNIYDPPLPNSVIKENKDYENRNIKKRNTIKKEENYGKEYLNKKVNYRKYDPTLGGKPESHIYDPPLPNSVIKDDKVNTYMSKEGIIYNGGKPYTLNNYQERKKGEPAYEPPLPNSLLECKSEGGKHSTQKPVTLMEWILKYYSREGAVVLDPTMGSGSMGVACKNMNRYFIGMEKDEKIFEVAMERLND